MWTHGHTEALKQIINYLAWKRCWSRKVRSNKQRRKSRVSRRDSSFAAPQKALRAQNPLSRRGMSVAQTRSRVRRCACMCPSLRTRGVQCLQSQEKPTTELLRKEGLEQTAEYSPTLRVIIVQNPYTQVGPRSQSKTGLWQAKMHRLLTALLFRLTNMPEKGGLREQHLNHSIVIIHVLDLV